MSEELIWEARVRDEASRTLRTIRGEATETDGAFDQMGVTSGRSTSTMVAGLGKVGLAAGAVVGALTGVVGVTDAALEASGRYANAANTLNQVIQNATSSTLEAEEATRAYQVAIEETGDLSGKTVPEISAALTRLTNITGETADAGLNMRRVLGLMKVSGKEMADAAKDLGNALTGDLGPMKELGILTADQIAEFNKLEDSGDRVTAMLEILDAKLEGLPESSDKSQVALARLSASWDQALAALGNTPVFEAPLNLLADLLDDVADNASEFGNTWDRVAPGVGQQVDRLREKYERLNAAADGSTTSSREDLGQKRIDALKLQLETEKLIIQQRVDSGQIDAFTAEWEIAKRTASTREQILDLEYEYGLMKDRVLSDGEVEIAQLQRQAALAQERNDLSRAELALDFELTAIADEYSQKLAAAADESERQVLASMRDAELARARAEGQRDIADAREREAEAARRAREEAERESAALAEQTMAAVDRAAQEALSEQLMLKRDDIARSQLAVIQETNDEHRIELEAKTRLLELQMQVIANALTEQEVITRTAQIESDRIDALAELDKRRLEKRKKAAEEAHKAMEAVHKAERDRTRQGIEMAGLFGDALVEGFERAKAPAALLSVVRAGFFGAEAIGLAPINPLGALKAGIAAGMHLANAAQFGAGGGGGGGGSAAAPSVQSTGDDAKRIAIEAYVEAFEQVNRGGGERVVVMDFSGATFIGRDQASARDMAHLIHGDARLVLGGGG